MNDLDDPNFLHLKIQEQAAAEIARLREQVRGLRKRLGDLERILRHRKALFAVYAHGVVLAGLAETAPEEEAPEDAPSLGLRDAL